MRKIAKSVNFFFFNCFYDYFNGVGGSLQNVLVMNENLNNRRKLHWNHCGNTIVYLPDFLFFFFFADAANADRGKFASNLMFFNEFKRKGETKKKK